MSNVINKNSSDAIRFTNHIHIAYGYPLNTRKAFRVIRLLMMITGFSFNRTITEIIKVRHQSIDKAINALNAVEAENQEILKGLIDASYQYPK